MTGTRDTSLDAIKGFTILIVMLGHVIVLNGLNDPLLYDWIKAIQMPLFMMVSGYLCGKGTKVQNVSDYGRMLGKRAVGYLLPFLSWTLIFHLDDFTWALPAYFEQPERGLWFLITLFVLTFMVYTAQLASALTKKVLPELPVFLVVMAAFAGIVVLQGAAGIPWLGPHLTRIYLPYYLAAYLYGNYEKKIQVIAPIRARRILGIMGMAYCILIVVTCDMMVMFGPVDYVVQTAASFGGCFGVIEFFFAMKDGRCKKFLSMLGMYTLEIYSIHYHFARILNRTGELSFSLYSLKGVGFVAAGFVLMSVLTAAVVFVLKKWWITDYIFYGKKSKKAGIVDK